VAKCANAVEQHNGIYEKQPIHGILKFEFQDDRSKCRSCGGSKFAFSHWQGSSLIQQLVAAAQSTIALWSAKYAQRLTYLFDTQGDW